MRDAIQDRQRAVATLLTGARAASAWREAELIALKGVGRLVYRVEFADDEPLALLKVVNSTSEPDGSW